MTNKQYKVFKYIVEKADEKNDIWWMGYHWIDLTEKQFKDICKVLATKDCIKTKINLNLNRVEHKLPCGLVVYETME